MSNIVILRNGDSYHLDDSFIFLAVGKKYTEIWSNDVWWLKISYRDFKKTSRHTIFVVILHISHKLNIIDTFLYDNIDHRAISNL